MYQPPKPKGPQPQPQPKGPQPLPPQPKPEQKAQPQQWQTTFTGTLGKNAITMTLQRNGEMITGSYSYQGRQGALALGGYVSENGVTLNMDEQDSKGVKTGHLTLHIRENGVHGMWYPPTGAGTCYGVNLKPQVTPPQPKSNEPQPKPEQKAQQSNAKPPTPPPVPPKPAQAANLTGSIGKYGIRMTLRVQEGKLSGNYGYISKGTTPFVLTGTVDAKGQATFMAGQETFTGTLSQDLKTFKGTWTAGGQTLPCELGGKAPDPEPPAGYKPYLPAGITAQNITNKQVRALLSQQNAGAIVWITRLPEVNTKATMHVSDAGKDFLKGYEGFGPNPYRDQAGYMTIGVGHLLDINLDGKMSAAEWSNYDKLGFPRGNLSQEQMMGLYEKDLQPRVANVNAMLKVPVTQELFDALVSLTFNAGEKNLANSDLIKKLNAGNYQAMPSEFIRWVYTSKKKSLGLQIRRIKEMVSFAVPYIKK